MKFYILVILTIFNNFVKSEPSFRQPFDNLTDLGNQTNVGIVNRACESYCVGSTDFCDGIICSATIKINPTPVGSSLDICYGFQIPYTSLNKAHCEFTFVAPAINVSNISSFNGVENPKHEIHALQKFPLSDSAFINYKLLLNVGCITPHEGSAFLNFGVYARIFSYLDLPNQKSRKDDMRQLSLNFLELVPATRLDRIKERLERGNKYNLDESSTKVPPRESILSKCQRLLSNATKAQTSPEPPLPSQKSATYGKACTGPGTSKACGANETCLLKDWIVLAESAASGSSNQRSKRSLPSVSVPVGPVSTGNSKNDAVSSPSKPNPPAAPSPAPAAKPAPASASASAQAPQVPAVGGQSPSLSSPVCLCDNHHTRDAGTGGLCSREIPTEFFKLDANQEESKSFPSMFPAAWMANEQPGAGAATTAASANYRDNPQSTDAATVTSNPSPLKGWSKVVIALFATLSIGGLVCGLIYYGIRQRRRAQLRRLLMSLRGEDENEDVFGEADRSHAAGGELGAFTEHDPADLRAARAPATNTGFNFAPSTNFGIGSAAARLGLNFSPRLGFRSGFFSGGGGGSSSSGASATTRPLTVRENEQARLLDEQSAEPEDDLIFGTRTHRSGGPNEQHVTMEALNRTTGSAATSTNPRTRSDSPDTVDEFGEYGSSEEQPSRFGVWGRIFGAGNNRKTRAPPSQIQNRTKGPPDDALLDDHNVDSVAGTSSVSASRPHHSTSSTSQLASATGLSEKSSAASAGTTSSSGKQQQQPAAARTQNSKGLFLPARLQNVTELDEEDEPILELGAGPN